MVARSRGLVGSWASSCISALVLAGCNAVSWTPPPAPHAPHPPHAKATRASYVSISQPALAPDASCDEARAAYVEGWNLDRAITQPDLTEGHYGAVLARGHYLESCSVPESYEVSICAAVQNGQVVGASVATSPRAPRLERCIARSVRSLDFPAHPRMDVTRTTFAALR